MKKVIKNVNYVTVKDVEQGSSELALNINGIELIDLSPAEGLQILKNHNLINNGNVVIPAGFLLVGITQHGGAFEYEFQQGDTTISADICFESEEDEAQHIA